MYKLVSELCDNKPHANVMGQDVVMFPWINNKDKKTICVDFHLLKDVVANINPLVDSYNPYVANYDMKDIADYSTIGNLGRVLYEVHHNVLFICGVFVHPRMRGKGWMKHLISLAYNDVSKEIPIDYIILNPKKHPSSSLDDRTLRSVYTDMGFVSIGEWSDMIGSPKPSEKNVWSKFPNLIQKKIRKEGNDIMIVPLGENITDKRREAAWCLTMDLMPALLSDWSIW